MTSTITLKHELTINHIADFFNIVRDTINRKGAVLVDTENLTKVDAAGVQLLIALKKECIRKGLEVRFKISDAVSNMLSIIGVQGI